MTVQTSRFEREIRWFDSSPASCPVSMEVALKKPVAMEEQLRFAIREGGRTVGSGVVSRVLE